MSEAQKLRLGFARYLAPLYVDDALKIAKLCDEELDPTGSLLGYVRDEVARIGQMDESIENLRARLHAMTEALDEIQKEAERSCRLCGGDVHAERETYRFGYPKIYDLACLGLTYAEKERD